jgi:uncharacterized metal-binding protein YceD (DUF177 family)
MGAMREYEIEFIKLKDGEHHFEYHLTDAFFKAFNSSLSTQDIRVDLLFIKSGSMFTLDFQVRGHVEVDCDRCLTRIAIPIHDEHRIVVKQVDYPIESSDDLIYISNHDYKLDIAQHIFDFVNVSIPIKNTCADVHMVCDPAVTGKITSMIDVGTEDTDLPERDTDEEEEE